MMQRGDIPVSAMALWSLTWCAKWRVLSQANAQKGGDGEDWSAERSEAAPISMHSRLCATACARVAASVWLRLPYL